MHKKRRVSKASDSAPETTRPSAEEFDMFSEYAEKSLARIAEILDIHGQEITIAHYDPNNQQTAYIKTRAAIHRIDMDLDEIGGRRAEYHVAIIDETDRNGGGYRILLDFETDSDTAEPIEGTYEYDMTLDGSALLLEGAAQLYPEQDHLKVVELYEHQLEPMPLWHATPDDIAQMSVFHTDVLLLAEQLHESNRLQLLEFDAG